MQSHNWALLVGTEVIFCQVPASSLLLDNVVLLSYLAASKRLLMITKLYPSSS